MTALSCWLLLFLMQKIHSVIHVVLRGPRYGWLCGALQKHIQGQDLLLKAQTGRMRQATGKSVCGDRRLCEEGADAVVAKRRR